MNDDNGKWVTINGAHVFIKDGETPEQALAKLSEKKKPEKYYRFKSNFYWIHGEQIIPDTELEKYKTGYYKRNYDMYGDDMFEEIDMKDGLAFVDKLNLDRPLNELRYLVATEFASAPSGVKRFLYGVLNDRIADHQMTLADDVLSNVPKHKDISVEESLGEVNGNGYAYSKSIEDKQSPEYAAYTHNCQRCAQAFILRWCHGYEVVARPSDAVWDDKRKGFVSAGQNLELYRYARANGYDKMGTGLSSNYNHADHIIFNQQDVKNTLMDGRDIAISQGYSSPSTEDQFRYIKKLVKSTGPGSAYICTVCWKGTRRTSGGYNAHSFCIINDDGKPKFVDPQTGQECSSYFTEKQIVPRMTEIFRADNCRLNGTMMKEVIDYEKSI